MQLSHRFFLWSTVILVTFGGTGVCQSTTSPLPLPLVRFPEMPPLPSAVVTANGKRLLLDHTDVRVSYDAASGQLKSTAPGWWIINYPLERIGGLGDSSRDEISELLFGKPSWAIRNWYLRTPGAPPLEPSLPSGPAPFRPTPNPTIIVDGAAPNAGDTNDGTAEAPLKTISEAVKRATVGAIIHIKPAVYRERVAIRSGGTADRPVVIEGLRSPSGEMPVITGNDVFPPNSWRAVDGLPGVYRAPMFTGMEGMVSSDGTTLVERNVPAELKEGEYCFNRGSREFVVLRDAEVGTPAAGSPLGGHKWERVVAGDAGFLDLGGRYGPGVYWLSTNIWVPPGANRMTSNSATLRGGVRFSGDFHGFRITGISADAQRKPFRIWVNGARMAGAVYSTSDHFELDVPHASRTDGQHDDWDTFYLREGWNGLLFQLDTTGLNATANRFKMFAMNGVTGYISSAEAPTSSSPSLDQLLPYVSEYLVVGPFESEPDRAVYVRLPDNADPNTKVMDLAARTNTLLDVKGDFVQIRGLEIRHGTHFQQTAHVELNGEGIVFESSLVRDNETQGVRCAAEKGQNAAPIVIRGNWIINSGVIGFGCVSTSSMLTAENLNQAIPGRTPVLIEYNTVVNSNWAGVWPGWEAGGSKSVALSGAIIRYNTILGGSGPGLWLDWEHFFNRLEGNFISGTSRFAIGVEASPGPNLIANNIITRTRPGPEWFRSSILAWDSAQTFAIHNTVDGNWNTLRGYPGFPGYDDWVGITGVDLGSGGDRATKWGMLPGPQWYLNNLIVGSQTAIHARAPDQLAGNYTDTGAGTSALGYAAEFVDPESNNYRLMDSSRLHRIAVSNEYTKAVRHDYFGLLRFADDSSTVGALRREPLERADAGTLETEFIDGATERRAAVAASGVVARRPASERTSR